LWAMGVWVPKTPSGHATCTYSCRRPPSRSSQRPDGRAGGRGSAARGRVLTERSVRAVPAAQPPIPCPGNWPAAEPGVAVLEPFIQRGLPRYTSRTIVTMDELQQALTLVRHRKVAVPQGEWNESRCAIAAPVRRSGAPRCSRADRPGHRKRGSRRRSGPRARSTWNGQTARRVLR
jgi:hypothetical protein